MKTALVTGSAGFIGYHTAERYLADGWRVVGLDAFTEYYDPRLKRDRAGQLASYDTYVEVSSMINRMSEERGYSLVLRVSNAPTDPADRQSVLQTVNRNIVFKRPDRDITQEIIARVNSTVNR